MAASIADLILADLNDPSLTEWMSPRNRELLEQAVQQGEITLAMYEESALEYRNCIAYLGTDTRWVQRPDGMYSENPPPEMDNAAMDQSSQNAFICVHAGFWVIESIFSLQLYNPGLYADQYQAIYVCIQSKGDFLNGLTLEEFREELRAQMSSSLTPLSIDPTIPEVHNCLLGNGIGLG